MNELEQSDLEKEANDCQNTFKERDKALIKIYKSGICYLAFVIKLRIRMNNNYRRQTSTSLNLKPCNIKIYYMTNSYRPGLKKFDWFKAGL